MQDLLHYQKLKKNPQRVWCVEGEYWWYQISCLIVSLVSKNSDEQPNEGETTGIGMRRLQVDFKADQLFQVDFPSN